MCPMYTSCATCSVGASCGWCDQTQECVLGTAYGSLDFMCPSWFFYNCYTIDHRDARSNCSTEIQRIDCRLNLCDAKPANSTNRYCQNCLDLEYCYNANTPCTGWNETRCPSGIIQPDYSDPDRVIMTQLNENIVNLDNYNISLFKCPVVSLYYEDNNEEDASMIVFNSDKITNDIQPRSILFSKQAGGIIHKINYTFKFDAFTFSYVTLASLTDMVKYADFRNHSVQFQNDSVNGSSGGVRWTEDIPSDYLFNFLVNYTSDLNHIYNIQDASVFKCVGRLQNNTNMITNSTVYSTYIVVALTNTTQNLSVNDYIYGNATLGFLERIVSIDRIQVNATLAKILLHSELVNGYDLNDTGKEF